jgi:hypothetical protein
MTHYRKFDTSTLAIPAAATPATDVRSIEVESSEDGWELMVRLTDGAISVTIPATCSRPQLISRLDRLALLVGFIGAPKTHGSERDG